MQNSITAQINVNPRASVLGSFSRSQVSSLIATIADYGALFLCAEVFHVWYVIATAIGAVLGAVTNFLMNRHWSFRASHGAVRVQAQRYFYVSSVSLLLNTAGVYLMTEHAHFHYAISVGMASVVVGVFFNYPMHRLYVYRMDH